MLGQMLGEMLDRLTTDVGPPVNVGLNVGEMLDRLTLSCLMLF